ncbi:MAG: hypothetical protein RL150_346 [Candidatus Parcubacteria bacterium]|jgi:hypothetical protein
MKAIPVPSVPTETGCSCCDAFHEHIAGKRPKIHLEQGDHIQLVTCAPCEQSFVRGANSGKWSKASQLFASKFAQANPDVTRLFAGMPASENTPEPENIVPLSAAYAA